MAPAKPAAPAKSAVEAPVFMVTGAAGNVGRAVLRRLAARGARLVAVERGAASSTKLVEGAEILALGGVDLTSPEACAGAVDAALRRYGRIDGVAHTVGGFAMAKVDSGAAELFERMFRLNTLTALHLFAAVLPEMRRRRRGALVAVGAGAALRGAANMAAYAASKSALLRLIESLAEEGKPDGVRANAVLPSIIDTPQNRAAMPKADYASWVQPDEVAAAIAFLLSEEASGVTGASLPVSGRV